MIPNVNPFGVGIYAIHNTNNGAVYIGQTLTSFRLRWQQHVHALDTGKHPNKALQADWMKDGREVFEFIPLEPALRRPEHEKKHYLEQREAAWMEHFEKSGAVCYNATRFNRVLRMKLN